MVTAQYTGNVVAAVSLASQPFYCYVHILVFPSNVLCRRDGGRWRVSTLARDFESSVLGLN